MTPKGALVKPRLLVLVVTLTLALTACGGGSSPPTTSAPAAGPRPSSTATLDIVDPPAGAHIPSGFFTIKLDLQGAHIVTEATKILKPDEGHIHLTLDGKLESMAYGLEQQLPAEPGTHLLMAEFVAGDHAPFNPRVFVTRTITVTSP
jgi:hypothetical protein